MQKNILLIMGFFLSLPAYSAKVEIEDREYNCDVKSFSHLKCNVNGKNAVVLMDGDNTFAFIQDSNGKVVTRPVRKISEGNRVLFQAKTTFIPQPDTLANNIRTANSLLDFGAIGNPELNEMIAKAKEYIKKDGSIDYNIKIDYNNTAFKCSGGISRVNLPVRNKRDFDNRLGCQFYSCKGSNGEKAIAHIPQFNDGNGNTNLVILKDESAQYVDSGFIVTNKSGAIVEKDFKSNPLALEKRLSVNADMLIPTGYKGDKKTYLYMTNANQDDYLVHAQKSCWHNEELKELFEEQKKIGKKYAQIAEDAQLIEVIKIAESTLTSTYVDKQKALKIGCLFDNKIYDSRTDDWLALSLKNITGVAAPTSYIEIDDVEKLYDKVQHIPGSAGATKHGAEARAHMISRALEELGIEHHKIWLRGSLNLNRNYNVAVNVLVKNKKGEFERYVFDPGTGSGLLTEEKWLKILTAGDKKREIFETTYPIAENTAVFNRIVMARSSPDMYGIDIEDLTEREKTEKAYKDFKNEIWKIDAGQQYE